MGLKLFRQELLKLINLLENYSAARAADYVAFRLDHILIQCHHRETVGNLLEQNRLLKISKKDSRNSFVPPSKDGKRLKETTNLRQARGKRPERQSGHEDSILRMTGTPDNVFKHRPLFCTCGWLNVIK